MIQWKSNIDSPAYILLIRSAVLSDKVQNLTTIPSSYNWASPSTLAFKFMQFQYAKTYTIKFTLTNSILLNNNSTYIYMSPAYVSREATYSHA